MRTTVSISDELLLAALEPRRDRPAVPVFRSGTGPRPGIDLASNRALHEALDEGVELNALR